MDPARVIHDDATQQLSQDTLKTIIEACPIGLIVLDYPTDDAASAVLRYCNRIADSESGFSWTEIPLGTRLISVRPQLFESAEGGASLVALGLEAVRRGEPVERSTVAYADEFAPAANFWIRYTPLENGWVAVTFRNLTQAGATSPNEDLALRRLEAANEDLRHFATAVAHDLKNPIATIIGFAELAKRDDTLGAQAQKLLHLIGMSARRATAMIDDLLDYSRHANQTGERVRTSLDEQLDWANETLRGRLEAVGAAIVRPAPLPHVAANPSAIRQVLLNLLENATKYRDPQRPLQITVTASDHENGMTMISVADTGIGIPADQIEAVFSLGHRVTTQRDTGDGIGLATCRIAIAHHGGEIWASDSATGARICFTLPLWIEDPPAVPTGPTAPAARVRPVRVLLADDDPVSEFAVQLEIHRLGGTIVRTARDGVQALQMYRDMEVPPDVVIADLRMPKLDGIGLSDAIRDIDPTQPIILRTAHLDDHVRRRATAAGIRACVRKQDINALEPWLTALCDRP